MMFYFLYKYNNNFLFPKIKFMSTKGRPGGIPVGRRKMLWALRVLFSPGSTVLWVLKSVEGQDHLPAQVVWLFEGKIKSMLIGILFILLYRRYLSDKPILVPEEEMGFSCLWVKGIRIWKALATAHEPPVFYKNKKSPTFTGRGLPPKSNKYKLITSF